MASPLEWGFGRRRRAAMAVPVGVRTRTSPSPAYVLTLLIGVVLTVAGIAVAIALNDTAAGFVADVEDLTSTWPAPLRLLPAALAFVVQGLVVLFLNVWLLAARRFRLFFQMNLAVLLATLISAFASLALASIADGLGIARSPATILVVSTATIVAAAKTLHSHVGRRLGRLLGWAVVVVATGTVLSAGAGTPGFVIPPVPSSLAADQLSGLVALVGVGLTASGLAGLILGRGAHEITAAAITAALTRSGLVLMSLEPAAVDARGSRPWFGRDTDGRRVFVKALGPDQRAADLLFRAWRGVTLKRSGDRAPHTSLRRAVEHEALVAHDARVRGITTPHLLATGATENGGYALAYRAVEGRTLDEVATSDLDADVVRRLWREVDWLHRAGIAHRDLRLANVLLDGEGQPWLIDFGFGELMAENELIVRDVAELLASTASVLGAERSVGLAVDVVGVEKVHEALGWLQPPTLSSATRSRLGSDRSIRRLRNAMAAAAGLDEVAPLEVERVSRRRVISMLALGGALWVLAALVSSYDDLWTHARRVDLRPVLIAVAATFVGFVGGAIATGATVPQRLRFTTNLATQLAAAFVDRTRGPGRSLGRTTTWSLVCCGVGRARAETAGTLMTASGIAVHGLLMALALAVSYQTGALTRSGLQWVVVPLAAGTSAAALALALPPLRTALVTPALRRLRSFRRTVIELAEQPGRLARLAAGSFVVTASHVAAMMAALAAVGVTMNPAAAAAAYLVGAAVAAPAPTPGGIGVVEAVLTSAYVVVGVEAAPALTAVLLFRLVTFWLPLLPGWASLTFLTRRGAADRDGIAG